MKKILFIFSAFIFSLTLYSTTWQVKQDSTGDFVTIQEGIVAASDSDTILVYPGTYYENIDFLEKSLTVASLYIITPEDSIINQTIIDGNQQARCVKINECENASIIGFTIQKGYALQEGVFESYQGGGIFIKETINTLISNCRIKHNKSYTGGGLYIDYCNSVQLKDNSIIRNQAIKSGGGIRAFGNELNIVFNSDSLNNIYLNYAATGSDISIPLIQYPTNIIVDTFTVYLPDYFFITCSDSFYSFSCLNSKIEEIDQDLYVAPYGDDNNSGLSPTEPLQTIAWAQTLIKRNDENPHTIFLDDGIYSPSLNNQIFPLNVKYGVKYKGVSPENTILDGEFESPIFFQLSRAQDEFSKLVMEDIKIVNGMHTSDSGGINIYQSDINLKNVVIENCNGFSAGAILTFNGYCNFNDVIIRNNNGQCAISLIIEYNCPNPIRDVNINNSTICDNQPNIIDPDFPGGGAFKIGGHFNIPGDYQAQFINCEISGNHNASYNPETGLGGTSGLYMGNNIKVDVINSTLGENTLSHNTGAVISVVNNSELNLYNTILYANDGYSMNLWENAVVNISHSLIEGGNGNINYYYPLANVNWLEGNINQNPQFVDNGDYPFQLANTSPCIDTGTLNLPDGITLPEYDIAGNPRLINGIVDMGAYEYQDSISVYEEIIKPITQTKISNYPNPFNPRTTIKFDLAESGKIELTIYNIKGQKIRTLLDAYSSKGHFELIWKGEDDNGKKVASGNYFIKLEVDGKEKLVKKCLLLK